MKRIIIKSVTSIADHAWFFKHFPKANSALKGGWVFKGNSKNFWLNKNSEFINGCSDKQQLPCSPVFCFSEMCHWDPRLHSPALSSRHSASFHLCAPLHCPSHGCWMRMLPYLLCLLLLLVFLARKIELREERKLIILKISHWKLVWKNNVFGKSSAPIKLP